MDSNGKLDAALIGIWATFALDAIAAFCSSPQTTELFADEREPTLMFWVRIAAIVAVGGGAIGTLRARSPWPLVGASSVAILMWFMYRHAAIRGRGVDRPSNAD